MLLLIPEVGQLQGRGVSRGAGLVSVDRLVLTVVSASDASSLYAGTSAATTSAPVGRGRRTSPVRKGSGRAPETKQPKLCPLSKDIATLSLLGSSWLSRRGAYFVVDINGVWLDMAERHPRAPERREKEIVPIFLALGHHSSSSLASLALFNLKSMRYTHADSIQLSNLFTHDYLRLARTWLAATKAAMANKTPPKKPLAITSAPPPPAPPISW